MPTPRALLLGLALAALGAPALAHAATCTFSLGPTAVAFGAYDPSAVAPDDSSGTFQFNCTGAGGNKVSATVSLSTGVAGNFAPRQMASGANRLSYNLYLDAARTLIWGDGTGVSQVLTNAVRRTTYTIYGRMPTGQWVAPGSYSDTITVTILY